MMKDIEMEELEREIDELWKIVEEKEEMTFHYRSEWSLLQNKNPSMNNQLKYNKPEILNWIFDGTP